MSGTLHYKIKFLSQFWPSILLVRTHLTVHLSKFNQVTWAMPSTLKMGTFYPSIHPSTRGHDWTYQSAKMCSLVQPRYTKMVHYSLCVFQNKISQLFYITPSIHPSCIQDRWQDPVGLSDSKPEERHYSWQGSLHKEDRGWSIKQQPISAVAATKTSFQDLIDNNISVTISGNVCQRN